MDASLQKFPKIDCKVSQQRSRLVSGCFTAEVSLNELQTLAAKVWSCQWMLHPISFTKLIANSRRKGPVLSLDASPHKFYKMNRKFRSKGPVFSGDASPQKFPQNELQSLGAKVRPSQWTLHGKSFTK